MIIVSQLGGQRLLVGFIHGGNQAHLTQVVVLKSGLDLTLGKALNTGLVVIGVGAHQTVWFYARKRSPLKGVGIEGFPLIAGFGFRPALSD